MSHKNDSGAFVWLGLLALIFVFIFLSAITFGSQSFKACKKSHATFHCLVNE